MRFLLRAPCRRSGPTPTAAVQTDGGESGVSGPTTSHLSVCLPVSLSVCQTDRYKLSLSLSLCPGLSALSPRYLTASHKACPRASPPPSFIPDLLSLRAHTGTLCLTHVQIHTLYRAVQVDHTNTTLCLCATPRGEQFNVSISTNQRQVGMTSLIPPHAG